MQLKEVSATRKNLLPPCADNIQAARNMRFVPRVQREEDQVRPDCSFAPTQLALCLRFALLNPLPDGPLAPPLTDGTRSDWT